MTSVSKPVEGLLPDGSGTSDEKKTQTDESQVRAFVQTHLVRVIVGLALVAAGVALLFTPTIRLNIETNVFEVGWPFLVIGLGLALMLWSRTASHRAETVAVAGGVVFGAGIVLALQHFTGDWEAWYFWPLAAFGGAGLGRLVHGTFTGRVASLRSGAMLAGAGVGLAVLGAAIEGDITTTVLAVALVVIGLVVLVAGLPPRNQLTVNK
jgi:uncharacterized membrane protein